MTISYLLAPNPKWYIADLVGRPLGGGSMYTYRSLDKTEEKFVFQEPSGSFAWTDPILFDENGAQGPFYWEVDTDHPEETYYIEVYDADGVLQWTIDNFAPPGGGGGSIITTAIDLENLVANNVMWRNIGTSTTPLPVFLKLAPGCHAALATTTSNAGPDINFIKNNTNATDQIVFTPFILGSTPLTGDVTPVDYLKYTCSNTPAGETVKVVQFPITAKVQNLTNQNVTITIWARGNSGTTTLDIKLRQFFGDGVGASPDVISLVQSLTLTSGWVKYVMQTTVPDVSGKVLGGCGNDALFLQVGFPLGVSCDIDFTKPSMYLGNLSPTEDYHTYDQIDGELNVPRTGDVRLGYSTQSDFYPGFIIMNDLSIGTTASTATGRANIDTFPLYNFLWNNVADAWAPVSGGRGASAIADFTVNKTLTLPRMLGRAIAEAGMGSGLTNRALGQFLGTETISIADMPAHSHSDPNTYALWNDAASTVGGGGAASLHRASLSLQNTGGSAADGKMQPTSFLNVFIKL